MEEVTHIDMAKSLEDLLMHCNGTIPLARAGHAHELIEWVRAIRDGKLVVSDAAPAE